VDHDLKIFRARSKFLSYKYISKPKDKREFVNDKEHVSVLQLQRGIRTLNKMLYIDWSKN